MKYHGTFSDASYSSYDMFDSMEEFASLQDAKASLWSRYDNNGSYTCSVTYVKFDEHHDTYTTETEGVLFPAVTREATITLYEIGAYDYPAKQLKFGPRMGVRVENC